MASMVIISSVSNGKRGGLLGNSSTGAVQVGMGIMVRCDAQKCQQMVYNHSMRTNIDINESLVRKARKLTRLKTKRQIVDKALELLVRSESRKGILEYYGSGIWKGNPKAMRRNRV
jgi:Arc/MetJ family transcription regulator